LALGQACLNGFVLYREAGHDTPRTQGFHSGQMREALRGEYKACFRGSRGVQDFEATVLHCGDVQSKADLCAEIFSLKRKPSLPNHPMGEARDHVDFCSRSSRKEVSSRRSGSKATLKSATPTFAKPPICLQSPPPCANTLFHRGLVGSRGEVWRSFNLSVFIGNHGSTSRSSTGLASTDKSYILVSLLRMTSCFYL
jgi:hypothetical protein